MASRLPRWGASLDEGSQGSRGSGTGPGAKHQTRASQPAQGAVQSCWCLTPVHSHGLCRRSRWRSGTPGSTDRGTCSWRRRLLRRFSLVSPTPRRLEAGAAAALAISALEGPGGAVGVDGSGERHLWRAEGAPGRAGSPHRRHGHRRRGDRDSPRVRSRDVQRAALREDRRSPRRRLVWGASRVTRVGKCFVLPCRAAARDQPPPSPSLRTAGAPGGPLADLTFAAKNQIQKVTEGETVVVYAWGSG